MSIGNAPVTIGQQQFLLPIIPPTPGLPNIVSVFASVVAPLEADPIGGEAGPVDDPDTTISFVVNLSQPSTETVLVNFAVVPGSAQAGDAATLEGDFSGPLTGTLTFAPSETIKTITLNIVDDFTFEPAETFTIQLSSPVNAVLGNAGQGLGAAVGVINDNDPVPELVFVDGNAAAEEGETISFSLTLSNPSFETVVVTLEAKEGTATEGIDFGTLTGKKVTFLPGETSTVVSVSAIEDDVFEGDESFVLALTSDSGEATTNAEITVTIADLSPTPTLTIANGEASEGGVLTMSLSLSNPSSEAIVVRLDTIDGSAKGGSDFQALDGRLVAFQPGVTETSVAITTIEDNVFEGNEQFTVSASAVSDQVNVGDTGTGTIVDDEVAPNVAISDVAVTEGGIATFTVTLSGPSDQDVVLSFTTQDGSAKATAGGVGRPDYSGQSGSVTIPAGQTSASATINVPTADDNVSESTESFSVSLTHQSGVIANSGNDLEGVGTILDNDDPPKVSINDVSVTEGGVATFAVTLSRPTDQNIVLSFATADGSAKDGVNESGVGIPDYPNQSGTVTIIAGQTSATVAISTSNDGVAESTETFSVDLTHQSGAIATTGNDFQGFATILDNDNAPKVTINDVTVTEGGIATFTVKLSGATDHDIVLSFTTVDGSAKDGVDESGSGIPDYTAQLGRVTIAAGETAATTTITVPTVNDAVFEPTETFNVVLTHESGVIAASGNDFTGIGTINDNDPLPKLSIGNDQGTEGDLLTFGLSLSHSSPATIVISLQTGGGSAIESPGANADYQSLDTPNPTLVTFLPGETSKTVDVATIENAIQESIEFFTVSASLIRGNADVDDEGEATIFDDDIIKPNFSGEAFSLSRQGRDETLTEGDDLLIWRDDGSTFDGGDGNDTLVIEDGAEVLALAVESGQTLPATFKQVVDLNALADLDQRIESIEILALVEETPSDAGRGTALRLDAADVLEITDQAGPAAALTILGSAGDGVELIGPGWSGPVDGGGFHVFSQVFGGTVITVKIDDDIALGDIKTG